MLRRSCRFLCAAVERCVEEYDVVIVGGGPAGLSAAIRLKQLAGNNEDFRVALVEKGAAIGSHTLSGACLEPRALDELLPEWKSEEGHPIKQKVNSESFHILTEKAGIPSFYLPPTLHNVGKNYLVSLGEVCKWMGDKAGEMGVDIFCGFAAAEPIIGEKGFLEGVQLNDVGLNKKGEPTDAFSPGMILKAKQTVLAEGCRGSMSKVIENRFSLRQPGNIQAYGLGIKEIWEVPPENFKAGDIQHTVGWPLTCKGHHNTYGGSFVYHYGENLVAAGFVVGLDYKNPYIRPYMEMQKWKTHPYVARNFKDAKPIWYGARTLVEGGLGSQPKLFFPGGVLIGEAGGFLNLPKIKGIHCGMKSGMLAAEAIYEDLYKNGSSVPDYGAEARTYNERYRGSWLYKELYAVRNVRQAFATHFLWGMYYTGLTTALTNGIEPWTLKHKHYDHQSLKPAKDCIPIEYPKPDGVLTFDLLTNHARSGTAHNEHQPSHIKLGNPKTPVDVNLKIYDGPEGKFCPAQVFEFEEDEKGEKFLRLNYTNCLHCKACDIKDPTQNITWTPPEGGGGPEYSGQM